VIVARRFRISARIRTLNTEPAPVAIFSAAARRWGLRFDVAYVQVSQHTPGTRSAAGPRGLKKQQPRRST